MITLNSPIYGEDPGFIFTDKVSGIRVPITEIELDSSTFQITQLSDVIGTEVDPNTVTYQKYALNVPGIGNILPDSRVVWKEQDFILKFGWHTNISNQELYTWYLLPLESEDPTPKTLYRWMINEIEIVHFR